MEYKMKPTAENFTPNRVVVENATLDGENVTRIYKEVGFWEPDSSTYAILNGVQFHNGTIEMRLRSRFRPDAQDYARGFIGFVFRASENNAEFESFYVRPTNGRSCTDPVRKKHGCQYFSYPGYTFSYFRDFGISDYEAPVDLELDEWLTIKAVIKDEEASFYLNGAEEPLLVVPKMKHGVGERGAVGVYVDNGTEGYVSDIKITCED